jgi:hypothetical protein
MSSYRLVKEEPPARTRVAGQADITPMLRTLEADPGAWYKFPREYSGYPGALKKRFASEGMEVKVSGVRNDDNVIIGYALYLRYPDDDGNSGATEG